MRQFLGLFSVFALVCYAATATAQETTILTPVVTQGEDAKSWSYGIGYDLGMNMARGGIGTDDIDREGILLGIFDALAGKEPTVEREAVQKAMEALGKRILARKNARNKEFLDNNKKQDGVQTTPSGLQYKVIKQGTGASPSAQSQVSVHYEGKLISGAVFDSSLQRGQPATFGVSQVIAGWTEALLRMKVGDKWQLVIPPNLAYGERGQPPVIGPNEVLIFQVELLEVK
ncbi:MAG: FKBP-type peptidyl-prolyl cis-trans isomerase [Aureliella sp.]